MTDSAYSPAIPPLWRDLPTMGARLLSVDDVITNVRKATWARVGFAGVMAVLSLVAVPPLWALAWFGFLAAWELGIRIFLEDKLAIGAQRERAIAWLAVIHCVGGTAFSIYPVITWASGEPVGMVLATAWICGSANHVFVYFTPNRVLTAACLTPLVLCAIIAPFTTDGFSIEALFAMATLLMLVLAAGMFGLDRRVLLGAIAKQTTARAAAEEANTAKSRFLATMSHELRTPLNAVIGYAELIGEESGKGPIADDADKIRASARQLLGVIDVILDLSRLESGAIELEREQVDADAVLAQLREAAPPLAALNGNTLTIESGPLGQAEIDLRRVHQCLMHLVSNAAKFTKNGAIHISGARSSADGRVRLAFTVADTGIGIGPAQQARIFDPFEQADGDADRRFEGTGLGLTLVRRLAQLMGGGVSVESTPGKGSAFTLWVDGGPA